MSITHRICEFCKAIIPTFLDHTPAQCKSYHEQKIEMDKKWGWHTKERLNEK